MSRQAIARFVVLAVWAVCTIALIGFILTFARNVPYMDDYALVPQLAGAEPLTWSWLWAPHNEHRFPLVKLVLYGLTRATRDYRASMVVNAVLMAFVALAGILATARYRGRFALSDVIFPVGLLHWAHAENYLHHIQMFLFAGTAVLCLILFQILAGHWRTSRPALGLLALSIVVLPLQGAMGCLYAIPLAAWFLLQPWFGDSTHRRRRALALAGAAALAIAAVYLLEYRRPAWHPPVQLDFRAVPAGLQILAVGIGQPGAALWPVSVLMPFLALGAALLPMVPALGASNRRNGDLALLAVIVSVLFMAGLTGIGRASFGERMGLTLRYGLLSTPLLLACYIATQRTTRVGWLGHALSVALVLAFLPNATEGVRYARIREAQALRVERDVRAGLAPQAVAARHWYGLYPDEDRFVDFLDMLRVDGSGPYRPFGPIADMPPVSAPPQILGRIVHDKNRNGVYDAGDTFVAVAGSACGNAGTVLEAYVSYRGPVHGRADPSRCNPEPFFSSERLPPGSYRVRLNLPRGWTSTGARRNRLNVTNGTDSHQWFFIAERPVVAAPAGAAASERR
jgi:hypothetical protein